MRHLLPLLGIAACGIVEPELQSVAPDLVCDEAERGTVVTLSGDGFTSLVVDGLTDEPQIRPPEVWLHPAGGLGEGQAGLATNSIRIADDDLMVRSPSLIEVDIDGATGLQSGAWDVEVRNPDQRSHTLAAGLLVAGPPVVDAVDPGGICQRAPELDLVVRGAGLLALDGGVPTVTVGGIEAAVVGFEGCAPFANGRDGEACLAVRARIDPSSLPLGPAAVEVVNPAPATCGTRRTEIEVLRPSTVSEVAPDGVCNSDEAFEIRGTNLLPGTQVWLGTYPATVESVDWTHLRVMPAPDMPPGRYDLDVYPPQGCPLTVPDAISIHAAPVVFDVDPPTVWTGVSTTVTARMSDVVREVVDAWLVSRDGVRVDVDWRWDADAPTVIELDVPHGLEVGPYAVHFDQADSCASKAAATVWVRNNRQIALLGIEPAFAWRYAPMPVEITAADPLPTGQVGVDEPPRFWLIGPDGEPDSHALLGVDARSPSLVTAIIPEGLDEGAYTLFAADASGGVGVLRDAVRVGLLPPPTIEGVAPATLPNKVGANVTIRGRDFRDPSVTLQCREDGVVSTISATVTAWEWGEVRADVPADLFHTAVCLVRVENGDGMAVQWAAVSITNPAQNVLPWRAGGDLVVARRAPSVAAGRTTSVSRWAYTIGGDAGTDATAMSSIEVAPVGVYGDVGEWAVLPRRLPGPRTRAGVARVGRFVYVVAGHDGVRPVNTLWRAQILDPLQVPLFESLDVRSTGTGLAPGTWTYRISAVFPSDHPANPGGESLPSEPIQVTLPERVAPTLTWRRVEGAVRYRIYRTGTVDEDGTVVGLLAEVAGTSFTDHGTGEVDGTRPLPQGSLGIWSAVAPLGVARSSPCVVVAPDPFPDPERVWLYAAGGVGADGELLDSVEMLDIELRSRDRQVVGTWRDAGVALTQARAECGAYVVDDELHTVAEPGEAWVFFAGGVTANKTVGTVDVGLVGKGGTLEEWAPITSLHPARAGFGVLSASNFLYAFGGSQARPSATGASANMAEFPDVQNWNALGVTLDEGRYLPGSARESAVVLIVGGTTSGEAASRLVEWTNW